MTKRRGAGAIRLGSFLSWARSEHRRKDGATVPWWAWPSFLALDAPLVAVAWLWAIGRGTGTPVSLAPMMLVAASVWLAYVADRLIDLRRLDAGLGSSTPRHGREDTSARHAFFARHRHRFARLWIWAFGGALSLGAVALTPQAFTLGVLVAALAVAAIVWSDRSSTVGALGRCLAIGVAFAGAVAVGLDAPPDVQLLAPLLGFGAVCASNLAWVAAWEHRVCDGHATHGHALRLARRLGGAMMLPVGAWCVMAPSPLALASLGALAGGWLVQVAGFGSAPQARSAAGDLVLVAPLILVLI